jgi:hypothetical protein
MFNHNLMQVDVDTIEEGHKVKYGNVLQDWLQIVNNWLQ